ncbi:MAG TPA: cytochrome c biogenesis protein CcsA [Candidatus Polarisedimenticolia bacterium]|nr:cytochrome c biogenesis protein CcsA [Candidatus Polarisedimenticolia bacterium]
MAMDESLILLRVALLLYVLAFINTFVPVLFGRRRTVAATPWIAGLGALAHTGALVSLGLALDRCPLATLPEVLSVLAWTTVLVYLVIAWRYRLEVLHAIILPLVLVVLFASDVLPSEVLPVTEPLRPSLLRFHLTVIVFGFAALCITFAASLVYVLVDRALKAKRPARFFLALPSLEGCERIGRVSLLWAFPLLTLGIVTGAVVSASRTGHFWTWQPKETLAVLSWVILGAVVAARLGWGWRGRKAAILTILGFAAVFLRMLGV